MTPQDHNKVIGIMHLIWGGFNTLLVLVIFPIMLVFIREMMRNDPNAPPEFASFFTVIMAVALGFSLLISLPPLVAGYALLKRKRWARVMSIIAACFEALSFPFGTALCVYTLWFMFGQGQNFHSAGGGQMYGQGWQSPPLPDASTYGWDAQRAQQHGRQREYVPPPQPPDWRGQ